MQRLPGIGRTTNVILHHFMKQTWAWLGLLVLVLLGLLLGYIMWWEYNHQTSRSSELITTTADLA